MGVFPDWWIKQFGDKPYVITDCIEAMKKIPDKAVDLVLTDLPYGVDVDYGPTYKDTKEELLKLIAKFMPEVKRISKFAMIFCGCKNLFDYPKPDYVMCHTSYPGDWSGAYGFIGWQPILIYGPDPYLKHGLGSRNDTVHNRDHVKSEHPCAKPLRLMQWCVERGTIKEGAIVLDPFLGAGTTLAACKVTRRIGLGFEINPAYEPLINKLIYEASPAVLSLTRMASDFE